MPFIAEILMDAYPPTMRNVDIRMVFPPYVDQITKLVLRGEPDKNNILRAMKGGSELEATVNKYHALYLAISDMPEWLVEKERFSLSHKIGDCEIYIQVAK
jgi:hypothetical protein